MVIDDIQGAAGGTLEPVPHFCIALLKKKNEKYENRTDRRLAHFITIFSSSWNLFSHSADRRKKNTDFIVFNDKRPQLFSIKKNQNFSF